MRLIPAPQNSTFRSYIFLSLFVALPMGVRAQSDVTAPQFLTLPEVAEITDSSAAIVWGTDEASDSRVRYRAAGDTSWLETVSGDMVLQHQVTLIDLQADQTYDYEVTSADPGGNVSPPFLGNFETTEGEHDRGPEIIEGPEVLGITDLQATVRWRTDVLSDSYARYRDVSDSAWAEVADSVLVLDHSLDLTGLAAGRHYLVEVTSTDSLGFVSETEDEDFRAAGGADGEGPEIIEGPIALGISNSSAIIQWETDEISDSWVRYQISGTGNWMELTDSLLVLDHSIPLGDLAADTDYDYEVQSTDLSGNSSEIEDDDFETAGAADAFGPEIVEGPSAEGVTNNQATVEWETDELSDSHLSYHAEGDTVWTDMQDANFVDEGTIWSK